MRRLGLILAASTLPLSYAAADDATAFSEAFSKAASGATLAEAYMTACDAHDLDSTQSRRDAFAGWAHRVDLAGYKRLLAGAAEPLPGVVADLEQHAETVGEEVDKDVREDRSTCTDFKDELGAEIFDIERPISYLLRNADDFGITLAEIPVEPVSDEIQVVPLASLSAQLAEKMDEIGSKAGAVTDRDLRAAREKHAEKWLSQRLVFAIYGRVTDDDTLREWRGDQQSSFHATCRSFADDDNEAQMAHAIGEERIIVGDVRWLNDNREGGVISLNDCRVFTHDPDETELASLSDDSAGLMLRPPEYEEAFAGPGQGIAMSDIDRVLYAAEFNNRIDGFGNGYTDRDEDIYVLLRDGTAYRHEWNFAFTDLDVDLSRQREPDHWFSWRESWGNVTLTQTGGLDAGDEIDLSNASRLMPVPQGQRLDGAYYYLNVGMGGRRRDRDYTFSSDGQLVHTRGGFVAGNFGTSYIIVTGDSDVASSRYAFDGYTLLIDGPDGEERRFVALIEGQDSNQPEEIIINGQVHWLRKDDQ
ncbi:hypothetical protein [Devosia sp. SD17-2]|uniref:hypothetical protein n=1 Tax=Devosia sp. SD17-2 TaxID=2976459 RepID=UPI0023D841AB|nr:hypothetical protein [Devosia sp. SD17-2]WEJ34106.1 hypothetical protein NYQ88_04695 [Devosia sp. SD17-2]